MTLAEWYVSATKAAWDLAALRHGRLVYRVRKKETAINLAEIVLVRWQIHPQGGSIRVETEAWSQTIVMTEFTRPDRMDLIRLLRRAIPEDLQAGWPEFCWRVAGPLRSAPRVRQPGDLLLTRRRWDVIGGIGTTVTAVVAWFVWQLTGNGGSFAAVLVILGIWMLMRFSCPKGGRWVPSDLDPPGMKSLMVAGKGGAMIGAILCGLSARWLGPNANEAIAAAVMLAIFAVCLAPAGLISLYYSPRQRAWKERKMVEALAEWERLEAESKRPRLASQAGQRDAASIQITEAETKKPADRGRRASTRCQ